MANRSRELHFWFTVGFKSRCTCWKWVAVRQAEHNLHEKADRRQSCPNQIAQTMWGDMRTLHQGGEGYNLNHNLSGKQRVGNIRQNITTSPEHNPKPPNPKTRKPKSQTRTSPLNKKQTPRPKTRIPSRSPQTTWFGVWVRVWGSCVWVWGFWVFGVGGSGFGDRGFGFGLAWRRFVSFGAGGHVKGWTNKQTNNETHEGSIFVLRIQCSKTWLLLGPIHIQPNGVYGCLVLMSQDVFRLSAPKTTPLQNHPPPPIPTANPQTRNPKT